VTVTSLRVVDELAVGSAGERLPPARGLAAVLGLKHILSIYRTIE
jgi:hypothetical protein